MQILRTATLALALLGATSTQVDGQQPVRLQLLSRRAIEPLASYESLGLSGINKPNGRMYRLRESIPATLPKSIPRVMNGLFLTIADETADGWLGFYREPAGVSEPRNARFTAVLFGADGRRTWTLALNDFLSRRDRLEITDIRYVDGRLYFNESCQSYSREAGGRCSSLVRLDPVRRRVEWRARPLVSNGIFIPVDGRIVAGYGFTAEPDYVYLLDRATGRILSTTRLDTAADYFEMKGGRLYVTTNRSLYLFRLR